MVWSKIEKEDVLMLYCSSTLLEVESLLARIGFDLKVPVDVFSGIGFKSEDCIPCV